MITALQQGFAHVPTDGTQDVFVAVKAVYTAIGTDVKPIVLQKLLFFANGIACAIFGKPLTTSTTEAWKYGPVIRRVWNSYKGRSPKPYQKQDDDDLLVPSRMVTVCVGLSVAAHGDDHWWKIVDESHIPPWENAYVPRQPSLSQPILFDDTREWFSNPDNLLGEVLPGIIKKQDLFPEIADFKVVVKDVLLALVHDFTFKAWGKINVSPNCAREINPDVVIWPGQDPLAALAVAFARPIHIYDVYRTQFGETTDAYLLDLARLACLGDWVALIRLSQSAELAEAIDALPIDRLDSTTVPESYAAGSFAFLAGRESDAVSSWEKCDLPQARIALASASADPAQELKMLGPVAQPHAAFQAGDLEKLKSFPTSAESDLLLGMLAVQTGELTLAKRTLTRSATEGCEEACDALFDYFSNVDCHNEADLKALAAQTQSGKVALATFYFKQDRIDEGRRVVDTLDVLHKHTLYANDGTRKSQEDFLNRLVYIATPPL